MSKKKVYVVPHSHWDREWYFTIEDSNVLLSENIHYLMDVLENDKSYNSYTFDAQLSVVEEFLKIYPEEKQRLSKLIVDKRIFIGPWYTQTDSLLVNKESIIRNLLYGTRLGNEFGHSMNIGYLPDIFGQNAYMPSIFKGFDIEYSILQRGIYTEELKGDLNFLWESPDGESVESNNIYLGYGPGKFLSSCDQYIEEKLIPMLEKLEALNRGTDNILLPAGGDQVLVRNHFPKTIEELNKKQDKYEFILSDYETFMKDTWKNKFKNNISGELIGCEKSRIHNTVKSQRYDIKKLNNLVENKIIYVLEPLSVIGKTLGLKYPSAWLDKMWKLLFDAHAHDSMGGCNSDDTNRDIVTRLQKVNKICDGLTNIIKKQITLSVSRSINKDNIILLFNTKASKTKENMETVIFTKEKKFILETIHGEKVDFNVVSQKILSGGKQVVVTAEGEKEIELPGYYRTEVLITDVEVLAMGYEVICVNDQVSLNSDDMGSYSLDKLIENYMYTIEFKKGKISLVNKDTKEKIDELFYFEDTGDNGDSYDYSPLEDEKEIIIKESKLISVKKSSLVQSMDLRHSVIIPESLEERKHSISTKKLEIDTTIELRQGENFIRINHSINNEAKDHRVRVVFNTSVNSKISSSDQGFSMIKRNNFNPYIENWKEKNFVEAPVSIFALENIALLKDSKNIFGVVTKGIKEYEIIKYSKLSLTLFRSVGLLGKDNLPWRPGRASGINNKVVYTKDAQMLQNMEFEYALYFNDSKEEEIEMFKVMDRFIGKYTTYQKQNLNLFEERLDRFEIPLNLKNPHKRYSLFNVDNGNVFVSGCKEAYEKNGIILRLFNPSKKDEKVNISSDYIKNIVITNLYEREIEEYNGEAIVPARGYLTLKFFI